MTESAQQKTTQASRLIGGKESGLSDAVDVARALAAGDIDAATEEAKRMALASPPSSEGIRLVAEALDQAGQLSAAIALTSSYDTQFSNDAAYHWMMAQLYTASSMRVRAEPHLRILVEAQPDSGRVRYELGRNLFKAGRHEEALPHLRRAVELWPDNFHALFFCSCVLASLGGYEEALKLLRRAVALNPGHQEAERQLIELESIVKAPPPRNAFARWPKAASDFDDMPSLLKDHVLAGYDTAGMRLRRGTGVFTQGSCFAANLAESLRRFDLRIGHMACGEEHNNSFANRVVVDWLRRGVFDEWTAMVAENLGTDTRQAYVDQIKASDFFIYTLGVAAAHFDKATGEFIMSHATHASKAALFRRSNFRTSTVQENVDNLLYIMSIVRELSPKIGVILTVSPVPMMATTEFKSAIISDCVSKSTLRVALHEIMQKKLERVLYWPSFEMVRWLGGHYGKVFGEEDGSSHHPNRAVINHIMDAFIATFGDEELRATRVAGGDTFRLPY